MPDISGSVMHFLYNGSDDITGLVNFTTHSFYTQLESLVEHSDNTHGGTISVAQTPGGKWFAKIVFADEASKQGWVDWTNTNHSSTREAVRGDKMLLPGSADDWESYLASV